MTDSTNAIQFPLSAAQMSALWPGLSLLIRLNSARNMKRGIRYEYPFRMFPPPAIFDRGMFDQQMMDEIRAVWQRLHPISKTGGMVQMNDVELRAMIFAVQANVSYARRRGDDFRLKSANSKKEPLIDNLSFDQLKINSNWVIHLLERNLKRATRVLSNSITPEAYAALMARWRQHLRWMSLHLVYFKRLSP
jgi:hypothetical protein